MTTEYLGQRQVSLDIVPSRVAYLIRSGSVDDFRRAVQEASTRWAGVTEPIIPVSPSGRVMPGYRQIVNTLDLDGAVNVGLSEAAADKAGALINLPVVSIDFIDRGFAPSSTMHPLNVGDRTPGTQLALPSRSDLWELTAAGDLAEDARPEWIAEDINVFRDGTPDAVGRGQLDGSTVLGFGLRAFEENYASGPVNGPVVLHFMAPNSLKDALWFWNLRALSTPPFAGPMLLLPPDITGWLGFREHLEVLIRMRPKSTPAIVIASLSVPEDDLKAVARHLGYQPEQSKTLTTRSMGAPLAASEPITYWLNVDPIQWLLHERRYGQRSHGLAHLFAHETTTLDLPSPVTFSGPGMVRARIGGLTAAPIPRRPAVAQLFMPNATWRHGTLELLTHPDSRYRFDTKIPTSDEILNAAVSRPYTVSDKGRYAQAIHQLVEPQTLLERGMTEVIRALTTPRSKELQKALQRASTATTRRLTEIAAEWGGRVAQRTWSPTQVAGDAGLKPAEALTVLERLTMLGLANRGLEINCTNCGMTAFDELTASENQPSCPGCRSPQQYTLDTASPKVVYRLNTLVDRASDNGVLGHTLTIGVLQTIEPSAHVIPGVNMIFDGDKPGELDLLGYVGEAVIAGEVKMSSREFTKLSRDIRLSKQAGADIHVLACTDNLPEETRRAAAAIAKRNRIELLMLDRALLRP